MNDRWDSGDVECVRPEVGQIYGYRQRIRTPGEPVIPALLVKLGPSRSKQVVTAQRPETIAGQASFLPSIIVGSSVNGMRGARWKKSNLHAKRFLNCL